LSELIEIQVSTNNGKGTSDPSPFNTEGGIVQNVPQVAPTLTRGELTDATNVELIWTTLSEGQEQGFSPLIEYRIYWMVGQVFVLKTTLTDTTLTRYSETDVMQGITYQFKISAVNI
jgi:hypothetical protein